MAAAWLRRALRPGRSAAAAAGGAAAGAALTAGALGGGRGAPDFEGLAELELLTLQRYGDDVPPPLRAPARMRELGKAAVPNMNGWHYEMMNDAARNEFYRSGLRRALHLHSDATVLDVGAGCGLLSLLAAEEGARLVVGAELDPDLARVGQECVERNGYAPDRVRILPKLASAVTPADLGGGRADVLVHECFGVLMLQEDCLASVADARERLCKKDAAIVPRRGVQYATLISSPAVDAQMSLPSPHPTGLDLTPANALLNTCMPMHTRNSGIDLAGRHAATLKRLSDRVPVYKVDFLTNTAADVPDEVVVKIPVHTPGTVSAVMLTWDAYLDGGYATMTTEPPCPGLRARGGATHFAEHWAQALQLVERPGGTAADLPAPVVVKAGQHVRLAVRLARTRTGAQPSTALQCEVLAVI